MGLLRGRHSWVRRRYTCWPGRLRLLLLLLGCRPHRTLHCRLLLRLRLPCTSAGRGVVPALLLAPLLLLVRRHSMPRWMQVGRRKARATRQRAPLPLLQRRLGTTVLCTWWCTSLLHLLQHLLLLWLLRQHLLALALRRAAEHFVLVRRPSSSALCGRVPAGGVARRVWSVRLLLSRLLLLALPVLLLWVLQLVRAGMPSRMAARLRRVSLLLALPLHVPLHWWRAGWRAAAASRTVGGVLARLWVLLRWLLARRLWACLTPLRLWLDCRERLLRRLCMLRRLRHASLAVAAC